MVCDHVGLMFFPREIIFRIIGRLAFPIFAFMIAEGAKYTRNKLKYFSLMAALAAICQIVYYFFDNGSLYMCILVTFSLSLIMIFTLDYFKKCLFDKACSTLVKALSLLAFVLSIALTYILNQYLTIDYGFLGSMVPVYASFANFRGIDAPESIKRLDNYYVRVGLFGIGLLALAIEVGGIQFYSLIALIPLLMYSEARGKLNLKYFFYLFYPLHLVVLEGIFILMLLFR